ncbi:MAG: 50S ribosomal protein L25 [Synergistaceae bacterium]|nr:50S ribosomal protein L25 [Synergistaceae bacterium]
MSERVTLVMEPREKTGKGENGRLRRAGYVPCILYGPELEKNVQGKLKMKDVERILSGRWESQRFTVKLPDGEEEMCLIREAQVNPLTDQPLHLDFLRLVKGRKINVNIPVEVMGRDAAPGVKDGGVLESMRELEVQTLPMNIPDVIEVDVSALGVGDAIHVRDLKLPEGVELLADPDEIVAVVAMSRGVEESTATEGGETAAADVEVVAKGKAAKEEEAE